MKWPGPNDVLFSLKAFAAAMLAFWIACALNLPRPAWAIFTVYILMQPISGAVRSKAVYRMVGTIAGGAIALLLLSLLAHFPGILFLSAGSVALAGVFLSMIDQMPRGYTYLMAGITTAVVVLPDALDPLSGFSTALARTEESLLGIACATLVDSVFFPHSAGTVLNARVAAWLDGAREYTLRALRGQQGSADGHIGLEGLAVDAAQLDALASHVAYDIVPIRPSPRVVRLLHTRMLLLVRLMFAVHDWAVVLCPAPVPATPMSRAVKALIDWVQGLPAPSNTAAVSRAIDELRATPVVAADSPAILHASLGLLLQNLLIGFQDLMALQAAVANASPLPDHLRRAMRTERLSTPYRDPARALLVLLPVALAFLLVVGYWTATGWDQGAQAAMMTLVAGVFASIGPEPFKQVLRVLVVIAVASSVAVAYQFAIIPAIQDFPVLVVALGLFLIPAGAFIPITSGTAMLLTVFTSLMLSLQPEYDARFVSVLDSTLGTLAGLSAAALLTQITLAPGTAWTTRHLRRVGRADLEALATGSWRPDHAAYALRALNRFTVLAPQLDQSNHDPDLTSDALLGELRIGLNILQLREVEPGLPTHTRQAIDSMFTALARYFEARRRDLRPPIDNLLERVTAAMTAAAAAMPSAGAHTAWLMLAGVQRSLGGPSATSEVVNAR